MKRKLFIIGISVLIVVTGFILMRTFRGMKETPAETKKPPVVKYSKAGSVAYADHRASITAFGRLTSANKIELISEVTGALEEASKPYKVGATFGRGEIIIKIDDSETKMNLYSAKSDFLNIVAKMLPDLKYDYPEAFSKWDSYLSRFEIEKPIEDIPQHTSPKEKYFLASRNIYKTYYTIKNLETRLSKHTVKAPFTGVLTSVASSRGAVVRPLVKLGDFGSTDSYELELSVEVKEVSYLNIGDIAQVSGSEINGSIAGRIIRIGKSIDAATQTVKVFVSLSSGQLKDGMYLRADIEGGIINNSYQLPRKAVLNNEYVYIINDGLIDKRKVELVRLGEHYAYIRGLDPGTIVIHESLANVILGSRYEALPSNNNN